MKNQDAKPHAWQSINYHSISGTLRIVLRGIGTFQTGNNGPTNLLTKIGTRSLL